MSDNWAAVGKAITARLRELGMRQRELSDQSGVSQAIVREIQNNTVERKRSERTLEALSLALQWHSQHLSALLRNRKPPAPGQPRENLQDPVTARLTAIEDRLTEMAEHLEALRAEVASALESRAD